MRENEFQSNLICELEDIFPGAIILKNDPNYIQGIPDLTILFEDKWAFLECKKSAKEPFQPNQEHYLEIAHDMSYAACIFPENKEVIIHELQQAFGLRRSSRIPKRK